MWFQFLNCVLTPICVVFCTDEEVGPNGRLKRRRKLSEKAAELQAERGRKGSVKKPGSASKLGKGEANDSSPVPTKLFASNGGGGPSSVTPKLKRRELGDTQGHAEDEVFQLFLSDLNIIAFLAVCQEASPRKNWLKLRKLSVMCQFSKNIASLLRFLSNACVLTAGAFSSKEERETGAAFETCGFIITQQRYKFGLWIPVYVR